MTSPGGPDRGPGVPSPDLLAPRLASAIVLAVVALHLLALAPAISRSYPADDTLLLIPSFLDNLEGRSRWSTVTYFLGADQKLPLALWKLYALGTLRALGPSNAALIWVGVLVHAATSVLVWSLSRRLGLARSVAWAAAGLHFASYLGSHAYLWPVGVQHVLTVLGILAVLDTYLATERRRQSARPYRAWFALTAALALVSSLGRATSAISAIAVLAHAVLAPGSAAERLRRYDVWRPAMLLALLYPVALLAYGGDAEALAPFGRLSALHRLLEWQIGPGATFALGLAWLVAVLTTVRLVLVVAVRRPPRSGHLPAWGRRVILGVAAVVAIPVSAKVAVVFVWGVQGIVAPLGIALNSQNTDRWHLVGFPLDLLAALLGAGVLVLYLRRRPPSADTAIGLVIFAAFSLMLFGGSPRPLRYWVYATPWLAMCICAAMETGARSLAAAAPRTQAALFITVWIALSLQNIAGVRLALWRHKIADTFQAIDYVRAAELIRLDLAHAANGTPGRVCIEGLAPLPNEKEWHQWFAHRGAFHAYGLTAVFAQPLPRLAGPRVDPSEVRLGCEAMAPDTHRYTAVGTAVARGGTSIDPFDALDRRVRALVTAGDFEGARATVAAAGSTRPFAVGYLLETLADDDAVWLTNGASLLTWIDRVAASHDNWYHRRAPKIEFLRDLVVRDIAAYVRFLFIADYAESRSAPVTTGWGARSKRLPFGGLAMRELDSMIRADPLVRSDPRMLAVLDDLVTTAPSAPAAKETGAARTTADLAFFSFIGRLLIADLGLAPAGP